MPSFVLNIARIRGCPEPKALAKLLTDWGKPQGEEFAVLACAVAQASVSVSLVRTSRSTVQRLDAKTGELTDAEVERATMLPFAVKPGQQTLEVYAGSFAGIERVGAFLSACLALPVTVEAILAKQHRAQLRSVKVSDFSANSYMTGAYGPKFLDTQHGQDFLAEHAAGITAATVRFSAHAGRVNLTLRPNCCASYSGSEDDQPEVQSILRGLAKVAKAEGPQ